MSNLDQYINTPEIQAAQQGADQALSTVQQYGSTLGGLPEKLRQAVLEKFDYNRDLIEQRNKAASDYFAAPSSARVKYADIGNPMLAEKLVEQEKGIMRTPWMNLNDLLSQRMGTIDKTVSGLEKTAATEYEVAKYSYEAARQKLQDLITTGKDAADSDKDKASEGLDQSTLAIIAQALGIDLGGGGGEETGNVEPKPDFNPTQNRIGKANVQQWQSPGGHWMWDPISSDWVEVVD